MSEKILTERSNIVAIADAVRSKTGTTAEMTLGGIVSGINGISTSEDLDSVLDAQESKLDRLLEVLDGKAAASVEIDLQSKTVTPTTSVQTVVADNGYDGLEQVVVNAIQTQTKNITPSTSTQTVTPDSGKYLSQVSVGAIPSEYIIPSGELSITENGTHDVGLYESVSVNVASSGGSDTNMEDAIISKSLTEYTNNTVTAIGAYLFCSCSSLTSITFTNAVSIGNNAFRYCNNLTSVDFPAATTISNYAFDCCSSLTSISLPLATTIGNAAFNSCNNLTSVNFPNVITVSNSAFNSCGKLTSVNLPNATTIGNSAFYGCCKLTSISLPLATTIGSCAFAWCSNALSSINLPAATTIGESAFIYCNKLKYIYLSCAATINLRAFAWCYNLISLYLRGSSLCILSNNNAFASTPIGGYSTSAGRYGSIYVPTSLLASYKTATNWVYYSSRFVGV